MIDDYEHPRKLYRIRKGRGLGVCHGIAEYLDFPVWVVQAAAIILCLVTRVIPFLILYGIAALMMKPKPGCVHRYVFGPARWEAKSSKLATSWHDVKQTMATLDRRIQRMENVVTSREYDWDRRLNS